MLLGKRDANRLVLHLVLDWGDEVVVLILIVVLWELLGGLGEVDLATTGASAIGDDVAWVDLLHVVLVDLVGNWGSLINIIIAGILLIVVSSLIHADILDWLLALSLLEALGIAALALSNGIAHCDDVEMLEVGLISMGIVVRLWFV